MVYGDRGQGPQPFRVPDRVPSQSRLRTPPRSLPELETTRPGLWTLRRWDEGRYIGPDEDATGHTGPRWDGGKKRETDRQRRSGAVV